MAFTDALKQVVRTVAPAIGTALGGPLGGTAVKYLADKFLGKSDATEAEVAEALAGASPEQLIRLKELDTDFAKHMADIGVDLERIAYEDRNSARDLAKVNMVPHIVLSTVYTVGYFYVLDMFFTGQFQVPESSNGLAEGLLLVLTTAQTLILQFWFGSSAGSKTKDVHLANSQPVG